MENISLEHHLLEFIVGKAQELLNVRRVILFGSRARGTQREHSDYDIAFELPEATTQEAWATFSVLIHEEAPTLLNLDLVNLNTIDDSFKRKILHEGVVIYGENHE